MSEKKFLDKPPDGFEPTCYLKWFPVNMYPQKEGVPKERQDAFMQYDVLCQRWIGYSNMWPADVWVRVPVDGE